MKPSEVIRETKNVLFERGWKRGGFEGDDGTVCVYRALDIATRGPGISWDAYKAVVSALPEPHTGIWVWNDARVRSFDEVIDVLDKAEKIAEAREAEL